MRAFLLVVCLGYGVVCSSATGATVSGNTYTGNTSGDEDGC